MNKFYQITFKEIGSDLVFLDIETSGGVGTITKLSPFCSDILQNHYIGKGILMEDMVVGEYFKYADPEDDFKVYETKFEIELIEEVQPVTEHLKKNSKNLMESA